MSIALQITNECFTIPSAYSYWSYYSTVSSNIHSWCLLWFVFANTQTFFKQTTSTWKFSRHQVSLRSIKTQSRLRVVFVTKKRLVRREILSHCHIRDLVTLSFEIRNQATFCLSWHPIVSPSKDSSKLSRACHDVNWTLLMREEKLDPISPR